MRWLIESLREYPEVALFLVLGLGYGLGELPLGKFRAGSVLGVLIAGIAVGQLAIPVSVSLKHTFFMLFLFAVGYRSRAGVQLSLPQRYTAEKLLNGQAEVLAR
jgi:putative transport protein